MAQGRIAALAERLRVQGVDVDSLAGLQDELDRIQTPPGFLARMTKRAKSAASRQWRHVVGELQESREAMTLLQRRVSTDKPLTAEESDKIRTQMLDLLRVVPAGLIAFANSALPVPGTGLLTPWLLARLGLMPSRWREAHLLASLDGQARSLRAAGMDSAADEVEALEHLLEEEADAREEAGHNAALLTHWDANGNGEWDAEERADYEDAVAKLQQKIELHRHQRRWFISWNHQVFGPTRLDDMVSVSGSVPLLICFDGNSGWVSLTDLLPESPTPPLGAAPTDAGSEDR